MVVNEQLRCNQCQHVTPVSHEDPDGSVADAVDHVTARHGIRPELALSMVIEIEEVKS
ncbi:hypothetical protein LJR186_001218 [Microbacterium foliorum]